MLRLGRLVRWPTLVEARDRLGKSLVLFLLLGAIYRYCWLDVRDPFKCDALLNHGRWLDSSADAGQHQPYEHWQPPGCMLHEYRSKDITDCIGPGRMVFVGDSTLRQVFLAVADKLDHDYARDVFTRVEKHSNMKMAKRKMMLEFFWDPYLNSTHLHRELAAYRHHPEAKYGSVQSTESANVMVVGAGLWFARNIAVNPLRHYKDAVDNIAQVMDITSTSNDTSAAHSMAKRSASSKLLLMAPLQMPWYESLSQPRQDTLTPDKVDLMNNYLQQLSAFQGVDVIWSYSVMTHGQPAAYEADGLHVVKSVAARKADILLNLKCNAVNAVSAGPGHASRTCCANYRRPNWVQAVILFLCLGVLPLWTWLKAREDKSWRSFSFTTRLDASTIFLSAVCYCYDADRTQMFNKLQKHFSHQEFVSLSAITLILGILSIRRSAPQAKRFVDAESPQLTSDQPFLSRDQTDEWKGWMQFAILIYHYTGGSKILPIYQAVRLLVASYLFMTGFGHTVFFLSKKDYSLRRSAAVLVRVNLLSCVLPFLMGTDYLSYYFAPLVSFWFLVVYWTMRFGHARNSDFRFFCAKLGVSLIMVVALTRTSGPLETVFEVLRQTCRIRWDLSEWRFRVSLDIFIVYIGMLCGGAFLKITHPSEQASRLRALFHDHFGHVRTSAILGSIITIPSFIVFSQRFPDKFSYNGYHPYISFLPILAFIVLRNSCRTFRNYYSSIFAWLGRCSLETFTLQFHIWLAGDTKGILSLGIFDREGGRPGARWLEFGLITVVFFWLSWSAAGATDVLTEWIISGSVKGKGAGKKASEISDTVELVNLEEGDGAEMNGGGHGVVGKGQGWTYSGSHLWKKDLRYRLGLILLVLWLLNMFRPSFTLDSTTGIYSCAIPSPTGIVTDPPLTSYGVAQARQLGCFLDSLGDDDGSGEGGGDGDLRGSGDDGRGKDGVKGQRIDRVYCSPYVRCLQTVGEAVGAMRRGAAEVRIERGVG
ncbi:MAG: hypothetical protein M1817_001010 [Caeruleum heppii]|nr:MAG: hypothetical protein M1817_001010 [Caeruleum heppii]